MDNHRPLIIFSNSLSQFYYDGSIYSSPITLSESETGGFKHVSDLQNNDGNKVKFSDFCYWSPNDKILAGRVLNNFYLIDTVSFTAIKSMQSKNGFLSWINNDKFKYYTREKGMIYISTMDKNGSIENLDLISISSRQSGIFSWPSARQYRNSTYNKSMNKIYSARNFISGKQESYAFEGPRHSIIEAFSPICRIVIFSLNEQSEINKGWGEKKIEVQKNYYIERF